MTTGHRASPDAGSERVRAARIRTDSGRSMSANLREGIALSHKLLAFVGAARRK